MPEVGTQTDPNYLSEILEELRNIREDTLRNSLVAQKYGAKGDAIFDVVTKVGYILSRPFRLFGGSYPSIDE